MGTYDPTTWNEGTAPGISAAQLNRMEAGIDEALRVLDQDDTQVDVVNTTNEGTLYSHLIPANELDVLGVLEFVVYGTIYSNWAGSLWLRVYLGGTKIMGTIPINLDQHSAARSFILVYRIAVGSSQTVLSHNITLDIGDPLAGANMSVSKNNYHGVSDSQQTKDMSASQIVKVTAQWSVDSTNLYVRKRVGYVAIHANS